MSEGVILGQVYSITVPRETNRELQHLAKLYGQSPHTLATNVLCNGVMAESTRVATAILVSQFMARGLVQ